MLVGLKRLNRTKRVSKAISCVCASALAVALVPAAAFAAGGYEYKTVGSADESAASSEVFNVEDTEQVKPGKNYKNAAQIKIADSADAAITPNAFKAMAGKQWYRVIGVDDSGAQAWEWAFTAQNVNAGNVKDKAYKLQVKTAADTSTNKTKSVTISLDQAFPTTASVSFPTVQNDGKYMVLTDANGASYAGINNGTTCSVPGITKGGTYSVSETAFCVYGLDRNDLTETELANHDASKATMLKQFTADQIDAIADTSMLKYTYLASGSNVVWASDKYLQFDKLFSGMNQWKAGSEIWFNCNDGVYTGQIPTYENVHASTYYWPEYYNSTKPSYDTDNKQAAPGIIALKYKSIAIADGQTAENAYKAKEDEATTDKSCPRFMQGTANAPTDNTAAGGVSEGNKSPSNIIYPTIVYTSVDFSKASVTIPSQKYTGKALTPAATVKVGSDTLKKDVDYTISFKNNTDAGTATATLTGKGIYKGTSTATFKIAQASQKLTTKVAKKTYKAKKLKRKAASFKIGAKTTGNGKVTYKAANKKSKKALKITKAGKVTVKKGTKKGTYKVTVIAAATKNYTKATKTVTVAIKK